MPFVVEAPSVENVTMNPAKMLDTAAVSDTTTIFNRPLSVVSSPQSES